MNFKLVFFIFPFFYIALIGQQCYPNFLIDQFLQDSMTIDFSQNLPTGSLSSSASVLKTYNHTYWSGYFTSTPQIVYCMSEFQFQFDKKISYLLSATVSSGSIVFTLNSSSVNWTLLTVNIWLFNRQDMQSLPITGGKKINNIKENLSKKQKYTINTTVLIPSLSSLNLKNTNKTLQFVSFLIGLNSSTTNSYHDIQIQNQSVGSTSANNLIFYAEVSSQKANIINRVTLILLMFYTSTGQSNSFIYDLNAFSLGQFTQAYRVLNAKFQPVINKLVGIKSFALQTGNFYNISQTFDMFTSLLTVNSANSTFQNLNIVQLIFSVPMSSMCPCNNTFVKIDGCFSSCYSAEGFYQYKYFDSNSNIIGKTCLKCPQQVGLVYNQVAQMCICSDGLMMVNGICSLISSSLSKNDIVNCPDPNSYLSLDGECLCKSSYFLMKNGTCKQCSSTTIFNNVTYQCQSPIQIYGCLYQNQEPNSDYTQCVCKTGYQKFNTSCVAVCRANSQRDSITGVCVCNNGFQLINQTCYALCGANMTRSNTDSKCYCNVGYKPLNENSSICVLSAPICNKTNQVLTNNICVCATGYYNISGNCSQCSGGKIFNISVNACACQQNYQFDGQNCVPLPIQLVSSNLINSINSNQKNPSVKTINTASSNQPIQSNNPINSSLKVTNAQTTATSNLNANSQNNTIPNIKISLASNIFTSPGIITDFTITPVVKRSQSQVQGLFTSISFSSPQFQPPQIFLSQNENDLTSYRCYLYYQNNLPYKPFSVSYTVKDSQSQSHITLLYDGMKASISNALQGQSAQSFLT